MLTLTNSFHNTSVDVRMTEKDIEELERVLWTGRGEELRRVKRKVRAIEKRLCGVEGCTCGDFLGRRA